ncbi:MAG: glycosyltransferase family 39 protein [Candidatus Eremiobacteraeota bacterium]|nr:glycosyltransferase family 39 protein [Candidatus Eremiobacteraeota bacterium]
MLITMLLGERRRPALLIVALAVVVGVSIARALAAWALPLTGDEAYYWEWSRRLAGGYVDHPPAVAFAIAAFSFLGRTPFAVRLPFVFCGVLAAVFGGAAAAVIARDVRAGALAAIAITLAPMSSVAFVTATPDGPYAVAWAAALFFAALAIREERRRWYAMLGLAIGVAMLSRLFGVALLLGVIAAMGLHRRLWVMVAIAAIAYLPFVFWNAAHDWTSFRFAFIGRHPNEWNLLRPLTTYALAAIAYLPMLSFRPRPSAVAAADRLLWWTAYALAGLLLLLAIHERVEIYWFLGPCISLAVALAIARPKYFNGALIAASAVTAFVFVVAFAPMSQSVRSFAASHLSDGGVFEIFTYRSLARDVATTARTDRAEVWTDGYGLSSLLDFYGGTSPLVIGPNQQGREALSWTADDGFSRALFVDKIPLAHRPDVEARLRKACSRVTPGPLFSYALARNSSHPRHYYTTWCDGVTPRSLAMLRLPL